ncbi:MAG: hypothetical protein LBU98_03400 [Alistipes sp.]|jgi:hypothetical protein|nr:hypothetical protein [Alistipes sp.]
MNPLGKTKKEEFNRDDARRMAARVVKKSNPLMSQRRAEKKVARAEKKLNKKRGFGL